MTSAIRLGYGGNSYYDYLLYASISLYYMKVLTAFLRKQFIQTVRFICFGFSPEFIVMNVRIERRVFIARHVKQTCHTFILPNWFCRCMKTQSKGFMITSSKRVSNRDSPTRQNSFPNAPLQTFTVKCRFL